MADSEPFSVVVATDCGSTTTKAILIERGEDGVYRQTYRGEAPTTVEAPFEDVTRGVLNAIQEVEELSGRQILEGERIITPVERDSRGVDLYVSTSSAGGGLQMMVAGVVQAMTGESAQRCALGAGAIVMDILAANDGRLPHEKIERIRHLRPDMVLISGGTDGGTVSHVVQLAEFVAAADPKPRFGSDFKLPVIYAGNTNAREQVSQTLGEKMGLTVTENLRPVLERENLGPARHIIHDLFLEHVMAQAPGYSKLIDWTDAPIVPTPAAVGNIMQTIARQRQIDVLGVDIGGATTDVFSVFAVDGQEEPVFNRTVSANLGMSYSISNVLAEAGFDNITRWIPFDVDETDLRDRIKNKMIRPTTIPQLLEELQIEHAISREALRLAFNQHRQLAVGLKGVQMERSLSDVFDQAERSDSIIDLMALDLLVASGGVLSHAPHRMQTAAMLVDAFQPLGLTELAVDSIFMMPHLGVLATVDEKAATDVFERDCLILLGTCLGLTGSGKPGQRCVAYELTPAAGAAVTGELFVGDLLHLPLAEGDTGELVVRCERNWDAGEGAGNELRTSIRGGRYGVILDARGRPVQFPDDAVERQLAVRRWAQALDLYPSKGEVAD